MTRQARHNVRFRAITFADSKHGWAVGNPASPHGTAIIYRTSNSGRSWTRVKTNRVGGINAVSFANTKVGWATSRNAVLHTVDGGRHWAVLVMPNHDRFNGVQALGMRQAWVSGDTDTLLRTVNGGATWQHSSTGSGKGLGSIVFTSAKAGWVAAGKEILHTADGGAHWTSQFTAAAKVAGLSFASASDGWATSGGGVYATTDGGARWARQTTAPATGWVFALGHPDAVIGADNGLNVTADGGATWQPARRLAAGYTGDLATVQFINARTGWVAGSGGAILRTPDGGTTWAAQDSTTTSDLTAVHFVSATSGWAVGAQGAIVATTNGGGTWTPQVSGITDDLAGVSFVDAQHGWAVGGTVSYFSQALAVILATDDGGRHWTKQTTPLPGDEDTTLSGVAFADDLHGWAVGEILGDAGTNASVILATSNGGLTWTKQFVHYPPPDGNEPNAELNAIACIDARHLVAVGSDDGLPVIYRTVNGGKTWTGLSRAASSRLGILDLSDVVFATAKLGWAVGEGAPPNGLLTGTIIKTTDGGLTWTKQAVGVNTGLTALSFVSPTQGWAVGGGAAVLTTRTGGNAP